MFIRGFIAACEAYGWIGGPEFRTRIRELSNGRERRNADWAVAKHRYTLPFNNLDRAGYQAVLRMFNVCRGMWGVFLYRDPSDSEATNEVFAVADGRGTYQLTKLSFADGVEYRRPVTALYVPDGNGEALPADPIVTADGSPATVAVDYDRGTVTFAVDPTGAVLRWSGEFANWVRFNQDGLDMSIDNRRGDEFARNGAVVLVEHPAPEPVS